jgi:hypothetical protein
MMVGFANAVSSCDSFGKDQASVSLRSKGDYSCGSQCTSSVATKCETTCAGGIAYCYANPFDPQGCVDGLLVCVEGAPECCTCG